MPRWNRVAIVGVGLIGGSIGLALRKRKLARRVVGIGRREESLEKALAAGAVTETSLDLPEVIGSAEIVVVCTPVDRIAETIIKALKSVAAGALITDAGSTKQGIVRAIEKNPTRKYVLLADIRWPAARKRASNSHRPICSKAD